MTTPNHSFLQRGYDFLAIVRNGQVTHKLDETGRVSIYPTESLSVTTPDDSSSAFNDKTYRFKLTRHGNFVTLYYNGDASATTDANKVITLDSLIPANHRPSANRTFLVGGEDNASNTPLSVTVKSDGEVEISVLGAAFTDAADAHVDAFNVSWYSAYPF